MNDPLGGAHTDSPHVIKRAQPRLLMLLSTRLTPKPQNGFLFLIWATIKKIRWFATLMTKTKHRCDHQLIPDGLTFNSYTVRCQFLFAHSSANGVMITQFALDEVIWLVPSHPIPSHPPPYVMFSSILTWCSHRRAGILSFFSSVLRIHHRMFFFSSKQLTGAIVLLLCWCRDGSIKSSNQENVWWEVSAQRGQSAG